MFVNHLVSVADILSSDTNSANEIRVSLGNLADGRGKGNDAPLWSPGGLMHRPADPEEDQSASAMALYVQNGNEKQVIATKDLRSKGDWPTLQPGDTMIHSTAGPAFVRCGANGSVMLFTTDNNTKDGRGMYISISPEDGIEFNTPWARLSVGPLGVHALHNSGARLDLGAVGGLPAPLDTLTSYAMLQGGIASVRGGAVALGTDGGAASEAAVTSLKAFCIAVNAAIATAVPASGITGANIAALASANTAFQAVASAIGKVV